MKKLFVTSMFALLAWPVFGQGGFNGPGRYEIMNLKSGKVLDLDRNDQTTLMQFSARGTDNQQWEIQPADRGFVFIRNGMNGNALEVGRGNDVRGVPFNGSDRQQWRLQPGKDGNALIVSRFGRTLDVPDGSNRDGLHMQVYDLNGDSNQRFILRRVEVRRRGDWEERDRRDRDGGDRRGGGVPTIVCSSSRGERVYCDADTRNGVVLLKQLSGRDCRQNETWGFDRRGIWVDRGCRAEFAVGRNR